MAGPESYKIESAVLVNECYRLLSILHGSRSIHGRIISLNEDRERGGCGPSPETLAYHLALEEWEANRILLNLAIVIRNGLETGPLMEDEDAVCGLELEAKEPFAGPKPDPFPETPQQIWSEFERQGLSTDPLCIKDACNKLIHAKGVEWEREKLDGARPYVTKTDGHCLTGSLFLNGDRQVGKGKNYVWSAFLSVEEFLLRTSRMY